MRQSLDCGTDVRAKPPCGRDAPGIVRLNAPTQCVGDSLGRSAIHIFSRL
jgi:hypothetical protein